MEIKVIPVDKALNSTSIDLGEYVINPYRGCTLGCVYCYAKNTKKALKDKRAWGEYVDVRGTLPDILERELKERSPEEVLLGSTTECFQPAEIKYGITGKVLTILNRNKIRYTILTRSVLAARYSDMIDPGLCNAVYFTVNKLDPRVLRSLEPGAASFKERMDAINCLLDSGIRVIPYISPVMPLLTDIPFLIGSFDCGRMEFEFLNFNMGNIHQVIDNISHILPDVALAYRTMISDQKIHDDNFSGIRKNIIDRMKNRNMEYRIYGHDFGGYFNNTYL